MISVQHKNINDNSIAHYYTLDENTGACKRIDPNKTPQLNTTYSSIGAEIAFGSIAAGSADQGFQLFIADESITLYPQEEYKQMTPLGVRTVFADKQSNYWICCSNGLLHVRLRKNNFKRSSPKNKPGLMFHQKREASVNFKEASMRMYGIDFGAWRSFPPIRFRSMESGME